jgi:AcrR family transcriptional regulator
MGDQIKENIQKTAGKLFLKYGLRSVSIDDICNELRISKKTFYTYFSQKDELIESVLLKHEKIKTSKQFEINKKNFEGNVIDNILFFSTSHFQLTGNHFINFFYDLSKYYPEIHKRHVMRNHDVIFNNIRENIIKGIEENLFRKDIDVDIMARFLSVQFLTVLNIKQLEKTKFVTHKFFNFLTDVYIRLLCNQEGLAYYESVKDKYILSIEEYDFSRVDEKLFEDIVEKSKESMIDAITCL